MGHKCQHLPWIKYVEILGMAFFEIFECFAKRLVLNQKWHSISYFRLFKAPGKYVLCMYVSTNRETVSHLLVP